MKKLTLCVAAALATVTTAVQAQEAAPYEGWAAGFVQYYGADITKHAPIGGLDDGNILGGEVGLRFDSSWALRFELGRIDLDNVSTDPSASDDDGMQLGADVMYFLEGDAAYFFGGLRDQSLENNTYRMATAGVGKHWEIADNIRVITEVAGYHDFGQGHREFSAKLGLAYIFGATSSASRADNDGDGVNDAIDRCPATTVGQQVDATGCSIDMDNDGVLNGQDACAMTPAGSVVDARGCVVVADSDNDGVPDNLDNCANTSSSDKVDANGCSVLEKREVSVALDMLFGNNSAVVSNPDSARIQEFAAFMKRFPSTEAIVEGHTSAVGDAAYNQMLSMKRANAVRTLLVNEYDVDSSRVKAVGFGETRLKNTANTAEANRMNRRIEVKVSAMVESNVGR